MGFGKGAPDGGGGKAAEAPPSPAPAPVVLGMELHCAGCAKKVAKSVKHMPGVKSVVADAAANRVVVEGTADAAALRAQIETKTRKPVQILSGGGPNKAAAGSKGGGGGGGEKKKTDVDGGGETKGDKGSRPLPEEPKEKKQPPVEKKPEEETVLLKIRLHCDNCADRIRRRIYKIKGVKDVVMEGNAKDEVEVTGTMDVAAMVVYLREKLGRAVEVEAVAPGKKGGGGDGDGGDKKKDQATTAGGDVKQYKGKGIEVAGPSMASAAASMAAPPQANTHHVSPYGYTAYPPPQPHAPPPSYYSYYGRDADGAGHSNAGGPAYYQRQVPDPGAYYDYPPPDAAGGPAYYHPPPSDAGAYYNHPAPDGGAYYDHPGATAYHNPQPYPYQFDMSPAPQMFSDENPNGCSVM